MLRHNLILYLKSGTISLTIILMIKTHMLKRNKEYGTKRKMITFGKKIRKMRELNRNKVKRHI